MRFRASAILLLFASSALAEDASPKKLKTDSPVRQKRIKEFLSEDPAKRAMALAEVGKWEPVPWSEAAKKDLDVIRHTVAVRAGFKDAKGQPVLKGTDKFKQGTAEREFAWVVPKTYDPAKPTPLWIYLHGSNGPAGTEPWSTWASSKGMICVAPVSPNRQYWHPVDGATDPLEYEESFFFAYMDAWRAKFNVDPERIYLSGFSAGGFGSWWFSLRYPEYWAAVMPMAGGPPANWGERGPYEQPGKLGYWIWHGDEDKDVPVDLDRKGVEWLKKLGTPVWYHEYAGGDHNSWFGKDKAEIEKVVLEVVEKERRILWPTRVVWCWDAAWYKAFPKTAPLKGGWWLEFGECGAAARIEGEYAGDNLYKVTTRDIKDFTIRVSPDMADLSKPVVVQVNGQEAFNGVVDVEFELLLKRQEKWSDPKRLITSEIHVTVPGPK
jgi:poly(3-hydroxybutyrate) depolymerase